jgi:hypothetical protein
MRRKINHEGAGKLKTGLTELCRIQKQRAELLEIHQFCLKIFVNNFSADA